MPLGEIGGGIGAVDPLQIAKGVVKFSVLLGYMSVRHRALSALGVKIYDQQ
jgi:hypothetical protein